jgi:3-hydroxybutyryl-CoA dehydrogenase
MEQIAVIGAGTMGNGIAHVFAQYGFRVTLIDISETQLQKALQSIGKNLDRQVAKGLLTEDRKTAALSNILTESDLEKGCAQSTLIIEAATENEKVKLDIFRAIDRIAPADAILATNTSSISITSIASVTNRPGRVIGMHFMNPVPVMKLVEVINGYATEADVTSAIIALARKIEKVPCVAQDYPGFIANRILMPMINEAVYALYEGVGDAEAIDTIMKLGMSHPMGPLELADFIGLDVCVAILKVLHDGFGNPKYAPCPLLTRMVAAGRLGVKSREGFYRYDEKGKRK